MRIVEPQESIQVTANPGAHPGLDNCVAQPAEGRTPEPGAAPGSASESRNPQHEAPDSSDRTCSGSLLATDSNSEERRLRLEEERQMVERMVEEKLTTGNLEGGEILMSALTMQLPGGLGP